MLPATTMIRSMILGAWNLVVESLVGSGFLRLSTPVWLGGITAYHHHGNPKTVVQLDVYVLLNLLPQWYRPLQQPSSPGPTCMCIMYGLCFVYPPIFVCCISAMELLNDVNKTAYMLCKIKLFK